MIIYLSIAFSNREHLKAQGKQFTIDLTSIILRKVSWLIFGTKNWDSIEEFEGVNEAASIWSKMFLNVADRHAPVKQTRIKGNDVPWMSSDLKKQYA